MARFSRRARKPVSIPEIALTPLIDVALTLLIIFMVTSPMIQNAIKVQLPQGKASEAGAVAEELIVHIDKDQKLYINGQVTKKDHLVNGLKQRLGKTTQKTVFVKADERVPYGFVIGVVDHIKVVGGIQYVALATQKQA